MGYFPDEYCPVGCFPGGMFSGGDVYRWDVYRWVIYRRGYLPVGLFTGEINTFKLCYFMYNSFLELLRLPAIS